VARRHEENPADEALHQIEESFDRVSHWVSTNRVPLAIVAAVILVVAAGSDLYRTYRDRSSEEAAEALAEVRAGYLSAMGAEPGALVFAEPANPAVGQAAREKYVQEFEAVGREHAGDAAAALAMLEAGNLHEELGAPHLAMEAWQSGLASAPEGSGLEGLLLRRMARGHEEAGEWAAAAEAYERAGRIEDFPARWSALADAARCRAEAGEPDAALALLSELEAADVLERIPPYTVARLRELRAARERSPQG
jgi:hypothetical protein